MEEALNKIYEYLTTFGIQLLIAIAIFVIGKWLAGIISRVVEKLLRKGSADEALVSFLKNLTYIGMMTFVILAALAKLGIQTTSFIAVLGAAGLAVGLALQGSLANFAAGVLILVFRPFKIGQYIAAGGTAGTVKEISIFTTILATPDNVKVIVPNAQIMGGNITNYSANETRRVDLVIGVSYSDDLKKAKEVLTKVVKADERVLQDPAPTIAVSELADSSVNFVVRPWVKSTDYWAAYFALTESIKVEIEKNGLNIPFPQRDLHIKTGSLSQKTLEAV